MSASDGDFDALLSPFSALSPSNPRGLLQTSDRLLASFRAHLQSSTETMLPSFVHELPTGDETDSAVAIDLGGSTLRVAMIRLQYGRATVQRQRSWLVGEVTKKLPAQAFFDWIAERVKYAVNAVGGPNTEATAVGITWSFPFDSASGKVRKMGKGYDQWQTIAGTDLKSHFDAAFQRQGLRLIVTSLMNDTEATFLSQAYANSKTQISLVWGTGVNSAVYLPLNSISSRKLSRRPKQWLADARAVLVNIELSMFGEGIFPLSDMDRDLDHSSLLPGFQPLEQLTSGRYLGEICRLTMSKAVSQGMLFDGKVPTGLEKCYSFGTADMSEVEVSSIENAAGFIAQKYQFQTVPITRDLERIRSICIAVSNRAALYMAVALFTLYRLRRDSLSSLWPVVLDVSESEDSKGTVIAFCGSVAGKHPSIRSKCQEALNILVDEEELASHTMRRSLVLEGCGESGLMGAAVGAVLNTPRKMLLARL